MIIYTQHGNTQGRASTDELASLSKGSKFLNPGNFIYFHPFVYTGGCQTIKAMHAPVARSQSPTRAVLLLTH